MKTNTNALQISRRSGTEGPRHDPYSYKEQAMQIENNALQILSAELREFCDDHNLELDSADALLLKRIPSGQRRWLQEYLHRWDAAVALAPLAARALATEYDTEEHERAHNAFYDALLPYMTNSQRREWDERSLKATPAELIAEAFRILGIPTGEVTRGETMKHTNQDDPDAMQICFPDGASYIFRAGDRTLASDGSATHIEWIDAEFVGLRNGERVHISRIQPPSVADYFEQKLGAKLPPAHPGETELDPTHPASPAHPAFHIATGCGADCKEAIDVAAALIAHLRSTDIAAMYEAVGAATDLAALLRASISDIALIGKVSAAREYAHSREYDGGEPNAAVVADIRRVAAEIVNVYVYG